MTLSRQHWREKFKISGWINPKMSFLPEITHFWIFSDLAWLLRTKRSEYCWYQKRKNHPGRWFLRVQKAGTNWTKVTGSFAGTVTKNQSKCSFSSPLSSRHFPQKILLPKAFTLALCRARTDWTSRDCCRSSVKVGLNGETLHTAQTCSGTPQHDYTCRQVWENRP